MAGLERQRVWGGWLGGAPPRFAPLRCADATHGAGYGLFRSRVDAADLDELAAAMVSLLASVRVAGRSVWMPGCGWLLKERSRMDPVTIGAVLAAIAGGAGGAVGSQLWAGVSALVSRPFRRPHAAGDTAAAVPSGAAELAALEHGPADERRAVALAEVLVTRAGADAGFRSALDAWWEQASQVQVGGVNVANTVSGGTQYGPVLQGRDFTGLTFGPVPAVPPTSPLPQDDSA